MNLLGSSFDIKDRAHKYDPRPSNTESKTCCTVRMKREIVRSKQNEDTANAGRKLPAKTN